MSPLLLVLALALPSLPAQVPPVGEGKWTGDSWCGVRGHPWVDKFRNCPICEAARAKSGGGGGGSSSSGDVFADAMAKGIVHGDAQLFTAGLGGAMLSGFMDSLFSSGPSGPSAAEIAEMQRREAERREAIRREMERQRLVRVGSAREMRSEMERSDSERSSRLSGIFDVVKPTKNSDYVGAWSDGAVAFDGAWSDTSVVDLRPDLASRNRHEAALRDGLSMVIDPRMMGQDPAGQAARDRFAMERSSGVMPEREMSRSEAWDALKSQAMSDLTGKAKDELADKVGISDQLSIGEHVKDTYLTSTMDRMRAGFSGDPRAMSGMEDRPDVNPSADFTKDFIANKVNDKISTGVLGFNAPLPVNFSQSSIDSMVERAKEVKQGYYDPIKVILTSPTYGPTPIKRN